MLTFLLIVGGLSFVWFLIEIIRLEGYPGRKWHHAYIGVVMQLVTWWLIFRPEPARATFVHGLLIALGIWLVIDDAAQHNIHNRQKRNGVPPSQWKTSFLHSFYEKTVREILD